MGRMFADGEVSRQMLDASSSGDPAFTHSLASHTVMARDVPFLFGGDTGPGDFNENNVVARKHSDKENNVLSN